MRTGPTPLTSQRVSDIVPAAVQPVEPFSDIAPVIMTRKASNEPAEVWMFSSPTMRALPTNVPVHARPSAEEPVKLLVKWTIAPSST